MTKRRAQRRTAGGPERPAVFWLLAAIVVPVMSLFAKIEIIDAHKLPRTGAYVLAPNHHSEIDPVIVAIAVWRLKRAPRFMAKESLFRVPVLGWALRATGMIPVARASSSSAARQTLQTARELVEHGRGVIVYPEGTLTRDPQLWPMRGKTGAVRLAAAGDIPLIPVAQWGAQQIMPRYGKLSLWPLRRRMTVRIGDPMRVGDHTNAAGTPTGLGEATGVLMDEITNMLADVRGQAAPEKRWSPSAHGQRETGRFES